MDEALIAYNHVSSEMRGCNKKREQEKSLAVPEEII